MSQSPTDSQSAVSPLTSSSLNTNVINNAPKFGTLVPNRVFVGGISCSTTEEELARLFTSYGNVKSTKIISDRAGVSKGYGFVTFEQDEEAKRVLKEGDNIFLRDRKLNIAPAIKKQPFNRAFEEQSPAINTPSTVYYYGTSIIPSGYNYQGGMLYYNATGSNTEQQIMQSLNAYNAPVAASPYHMMYQNTPQPMLIHHGYPQQPPLFQPLQFVSTVDDMLLK